MIEVSFAAVETAAGDIGSTAQRVNATLQQLKADLAPVTRDQSNWDGDTAANYRTYQDMWDRASEDLNSVLAQISQAVAASHANYVAAESTNAAMWAG
ncbi:MAG: WXG100 family type VII secretion target [Actinomycetota bacterium]|nr:WXG100 family type VII secretion target [Actinomycetota bacterium]